MISLDHVNHIEFKNMCTRFVCLKCHITTRRRVTSNANCENQALKV